MMCAVKACAMGNLERVQQLIEEGVVSQRHSEKE